MRISVHERYDHQPPNPSTLVDFLVASVYLLVLGPGLGGIPAPLHLLLLRFPALRPVGCIMGIPGADTDALAVSVHTLSLYSSYILEQHPLLRRSRRPTALQRRTRRPIFLMLSAFVNVFLHPTRTYCLILRLLTLFESECLPWGSGRWMIVPISPVLEFSSAGAWGFWWS